MEDEAASAAKTRQINTAFLAALFQYDFEKLHLLLGPVLDFKSPNLMVIIQTRTRPKAGIIALEKEMLPYLLGGIWTTTLMPFDNDSAINGKFMGCSVQIFQRSKTPHPSDPKASQKKFIVGKISGGQDLRDVVKTIPDVLNAVVTGFTHPDHHNMLTVSFEPFLRQIWVEGNINHPARNTPFLRFLHLVNGLLGQWFLFAATFYESPDLRPSAQDFVTHSRDILYMPREMIEDHKKRGDQVDEQFSNEWFPPVVPAGKVANQQPQAQQQKPGPYQQPTRQ